MENKPAYKFLTNVPTKITLLFDKPLEKTGQYGDYWIYKANINGEEESFFANSELHSLLTNKKKGDVVEIKSVEDYVNGKRMVHYTTGEVSVASKVINQKVTEIKTTTEQEKWDKIAIGKVRHGFALEAFKMTMPLNSETKKIVDDWTNYVMTGDISIKQSELPTINVDDEWNIDESVKNIPIF